MVTARLSLPDNFSDEIREAVIRMEQGGYSKVASAPCTPLRVADMAGRQIVFAMNAGRVWESEEADLQALRRSISIISAAVMLLGKYSSSSSESCSRDFSLIHRGPLSMCLEDVFA